jgi:hypothetical protein
MFRSIFGVCQSLKDCTQHHSQRTFCGMQSSFTPIKNGPTKGARSVRVPKARGGPQNTHRAERADQGCVRHSAERV